MPIALSLLASCSLFIPPRAWHPAIDFEEVPTCPSYAWPVLDGAIGGAGALIATGLLDCHGTTAIGDFVCEGPVRLVGFAILVPSLVYAASTIYGAVRARQCRGELTDLRAIRGEN